VSRTESKDDPTREALDPAAITFIAGGARRKANTRERLLTAAMNEFADRGYGATSIEDIVARAKLSRMSFYRNFKGKADVAIELFRAAAEVSTPEFLAITSVDYRDPALVRRWIERVFAGDQQNRVLLNILMQATSDQQGFTRRAQEYLSTLINRLGESIPAFALDPDEPSQRQRWLEAWLVLYEILDQSNHAALNSGVADDPLVIDILAERFVRFVQED
jgi:AcrR family transcriptional regulator